MRTADYSPPYTAAVKNMWSYTSSPLVSSSRGAQLNMWTNFILGLFNEGARGIVVG
jgi:hypothetical protein